MSLYKEGTNHAMASGKYAGEVAISAKKAGDFSRSFLLEYDKKLKNGKVFEDLKKYRKLPEVLEKTPNLFSLYPEKICALLVDYFKVNTESKSRIQKKAVMNLLKGMPWIHLAKDLFRARNLV